MQGRTDGFTIIELTLFLAISGLLLMAMLIGTGTMAARQRFTDTTDSLQTFFQSQYEEVINGVNVRSSSNSCTADGGTTTTPGKSQCLLLGKVLTIHTTNTKADMAYIVSTINSDDYGGSDQEKLKKAGLQVVADGMTTYELKWGATFSQTSRSTSLLGGSGRGSVNSIAFIRLPDSDRIQQLYYQNSIGYSASNLTTALTNTLTNDSEAFSPRADATGASLAVCVKNDKDFTSSPRAAIIFGQGKGAGTITTNYEPGDLCLL